jgi:5-methylcytosine-specific restriction protein A
MTRARYLRFHPRCQEVGCKDAATTVDHVIARADGGTDHWSNLRAYCTPHHSSKTNRYDGGGGHSRH